MKIIHKLSYVLMAGLVLVGCKPPQEPDGPNNETSELTLSVNKESIMSDGRDAAEFTVKYGDKDVTKKATIKTGDTVLEGNTFISTDPGDHIFTATYQDPETETVFTSNEVKVTVSSLVLTVEPSELSVSGGKAVFKVTYLDEDKTANSTITNLTDGVDFEKGVNEFIAPGYTGEFQFKAKFNNLTSNTVTVKVGAPVVSDLVLVADKGRVSVGEQVTFTVFHKNTDVTSDAKIKVVSGNYINGNTFTATAGTTEFVAEYNEATSPSVFVSTGKFYKNVLVLKFTNINCGYCTTMAAALERANTLYPDRMVEVAVHHPKQGDEDPMITPVTPQFDEYFPQMWANGIPVTSYDMTNTVIGATGSSDILSRVKPLVQKVPGVGIAASSSVSENTVTDKDGNEITTAKATVNVNVTAATSNTYYLTVMLLENGIPYRQASAPANYLHNHTLRYTASSSVFGDSLGELTENQQVSKQYDIELDSKYVRDNCTIVCYVTYKEGNKWVAANAIELPVVGRVDYKFE